MGVEDDDNKAPGSSEDDSAGPVGGERLAACRRERGISVHEIAKELHLDEPKVRALEENRFDVLGAPVFAKGHLRKYAELVGVPIDDVLADYYQLNRSVGAPPVVGPPRKDPREISVSPWIAGVVVMIVVAAAAWWWIAREPMTTPVTVEPATLAPFEFERQDDPIADVEGTVTAAEESDTSEPADDPQIVHLVEHAQVAPPAATGRVLRDVGGGARARRHGTEELRGLRIPRSALHHGYRRAAGDHREAPDHPLPDGADDVHSAP